SKILTVLDFSFYGPTLRDRRREDHNLVHHHSRNHMSYLPNSDSTTDASPATVEATFFNFTG
ncbi:hypothetical protein MKX01_041162, partial [Papaver californicum]